MNFEGLDEECIIQEQAINFSYTQQQPNDIIPNQHVSILGLQTSFLDTPSQGNHTSKIIDLNESHEAIYINQQEDDKPLIKVKRLNNELVAKFEIYESSSDDELSQGAFESAA